MIQFAELYDVYGSDGKLVPGQFTRSLGKSGMLAGMSAIYFVKLIPPRATFPLDMTADERALMQQHVAYFGQLFDAGKVLIYGPVMATDAAYGMGILDVADEAEALSIMESDPSVKAMLNRYELAPMRVGGAQGRRSTDGT